VAVWRQRHNQQHHLDDKEAEVKDMVVEAVDKPTKPEETEAAAQPGELGHFSKKTPMA
jgi:hypothetical protein